MRSRPALIGVDWGTTSFRAYLIDRRGSVLDARDRLLGILNIEDRAFEQVLETEIAPWLALTGNLPVVLSGMIASRNGWVETPYVGIPAGLETFAETLVPHRLSSGRFIHFVAGLSLTDAHGAPDVMRGEETEILGHLALRELASADLILPGTHSKWARVEDRKITHFTTYMTGEIHAALKDHTILGRLIEDGPFAEAAFETGVRRSTNEPSSLLHQLFTARTLPLFEKLKHRETADYLSGLLIGAELKAGLETAGRSGLTIIGRGELARRYQGALRVLGHHAQIAEPGAVARGQFEIAQKAGFLHA